MSIFSSILANTKLFMECLNQVLVSGGPNVEQKIYVCVGFIEQVNIASFISELACFIRVACIKESF